MAGRINPKTGRRPSASGAVPAQVRQEARKVVKLTEKIKELEIQETRLKEAIKKADADIKYWTDIKNNPANEAAYLNAVNKIAEIKTQKIKFDADLKTTSANLNTARSEKNSIINKDLFKPPIWQNKNMVGNRTTVGSGKSETETPLTNTPNLPKLQWEYNPPMVKSAYLSPLGIQKQDSWLPVDAGALTDGIDSWRSSVGSKGVIQMSRKYPYQAYSWNDKKEGKLATDAEILYGFRFLYNPTTVQMSWGVSTEINPAYFAAGKLVANPITDAALNSSITFSLLLNRMLDMNVVSENGISNTNSYPNQISNEDAIGIYEKGTMHDLEYLFRAVNGVNVDYSAPLQKYLKLKTADLGWLQSFPVELHLGYSLRYLIRVSSINVEHKIFNERMVPILSQVDLVCKRLPDIQLDADGDGVGGGGTSTGFQVR